MDGRMRIATCPDCRSSTIGVCHRHMNEPESKPQEFVPTISHLTDYGGVVPYVAKSLYDDLKKERDYWKTCHATDTKDLVSVMGERDELKKENAKLLADLEMVRASQERQRGLNRQAWEREKKLREALEELMATNPCDPDLTKESWDANQKARTALGEEK